MSVAISPELQKELDELKASEAANTQGGSGEKPKVKVELVSGNIYIQGGCYCVKKFKTIEGEDGDDSQTKEAYYSPISNFTLECKCLIRGKESKRIIEIKGSTGISRIVEAKMADLNSPMAFYSLMESQGNFVSKLPADGLFNIKRKIFGNEKTADRIDVIGHHEDGFFVFGNGIYNYSDFAFYPVDDYGICEVGKRYYYIPAFSLTNAERIANKDMQSYYYSPGGTSFREISDSFVKVFGDNGRVGIGFVLASIFSDIIFEACGNFPLLFAYGVKGSGKTSFAEKLASIFKKDATCINIEKGGSSAVGTNRALGQVRNGLVPMDEFKVDADRNMIGFIKRIYDRIGRVTGKHSANQETRVDEVLSAALICGEHMPENNAALFSRLVQLTFSNAAYTSEQKDNFDNLTDLLATNNGCALVEVLQYRDLFKTQFKAKFREVRADMRKDNRTALLSDRDLQKLSQIAATLRLVENKGLLSDDVDQTISFLIDAIVKQGKVVESINEVSEFWRIFSELDGEGEFDIKDHEKGRPEYYTTHPNEDLIILNLTIVIGMIRERAIKRDYRTIKDIPIHTLSNYLKKSDAYKANGTKDGRYNMPCNKKGHGFSYSAIQTIWGEAVTEKIEIPWDDFD